MEYSEVRNIMFNSNEAACIPVSLEESVPFQCEVNGVPIDIKTQRRFLMK